MDSELSIKLQQIFKQIGAMPNDENLHNKWLQLTDSLENWILDLLDIQDATDEKSKSTVKARLTKDKAWLGDLLHQRQTIEKQRDRQCICVFFSRGTYPNRKLYFTTYDVYEAMENDGSYEEIIKPNLGLSGLFNMEETIQYCLRTHTKANQVFALADYISCHLDEDTNKSNKHGIRPSA